MKILHIASHKGNVGDMINHKGFYILFKDLLGEARIDKVEMRDFYYSAKERKSFDKEYAELINTYDLCVIGGGGYFDVQWDHSATGTTLDFSEEFVDKIEIPVLVNAMGYHEYPGITNEKMCACFKKILDIIAKKRNWLITVRNDGSIERMKHTYGDLVEQKVCKVPDNGFFCPFDFTECPKENVLGLCITNDLFSRDFNNGISENEFNGYISCFIEKQIAKGWKVMLIPHTPADVAVIGAVLTNLSAEHKRNSIIVASYDANSELAIEQLAWFYSRCNCIIGMRFHSLITGLNLRIPTIALAGHAQIKALFDDLNLEEYCVKVNTTDVDDILESVLEKCMSDVGLKDRYESIYIRLNTDKELYKENVMNFLKNKKIS